GGRVGRVLPLDRVIGQGRRVSWAVAAHRALVRLIGYGAPPLVTGAYPPGARRPENRLAIQVLGPETPAVPVPLRDGAGRGRSALVVLGPAGGGAGGGGAEAGGGDGADVAARPRWHDGPHRPGGRPGAGRSAVLAAVGAGPAAAVGDGPGGGAGHAGLCGLDVR